MRLFAKRVTDPDVCFVKNVLELLTAMDNYTTEVAWVPISHRVLNKRGLNDKVIEHSEKIPGYIVNECYPDDRNILMNQAEALFEIASSAFDLLEHNGMLSDLSNIISRMPLNDSEKRQLLIKYLFKGENTDFHNKLIDTYLLEMFSH